MKLTLTNALIRDYLARQEWPQPEPGRLHLLGLRGAIPAGGDAVEVIPAQANRYDDTLATFGEALETFRASVDPGSAWTKRPSNPQGCAHLLNGHWLYQRGTHKKRRALTQAAPVKVWRDRDRDGGRDPREIVDTGWFGINIHAAGTSPTVDAWSAGCQVLFGGWTGKPWQRFMGLIEAANQKTYRYYLIDAAGLAKFAG